MNQIDQILNLAALLLWFNWRSARFVRRPDLSVLSLAATLKKAGPNASIRLFYASSLAGLLLVRSVAYWHLGTGANWTPALDLVAISLPFRSDHFHLMLIYSFLSFAVTLAMFYAWLLLISVANRKVPDGDPLQKLLRLHLGWLEHCPAVVKLLLPMASAFLAWCVLSPICVRLGTIPSPISRVHLCQQAAVLCVASLLCWKYLLIVIFLLHLLNSYVYLGNAAILSFATTTARNLLRCVGWLPLQIGRLDFAPLAGTALVLVAAEFGTNWLPRIYQRLPF